MSLVTFTLYLLQLLTRPSSAPGALVWGMSLYLQSTFKARGVNAGGECSHPLKSDWPGAWQCANEEQCWWKWNITSNNCLDSIFSPIFNKYFCSLCPAGHPHLTHVCRVHVKLSCNKHFYAGKTAAKGLRRISLMLECGITSSYHVPSSSPLVYRQYLFGTYIHLVSLYCMCIHCTYVQYVHVRIWSCSLSSVYCISTL